MIHFRRVSILIVVATVTIAAVADASQAVLSQRVESLAKAAPAECAGVGTQAHEIVVGEFFNESLPILITNPCPFDVVGRMEVHEVSATSEGPNPDFSGPRTPLLFSLRFAETKEAEFQIFAKPELTQEQLEILARDVAYRDHWVQYRIGDRDWPLPSLYNHLGLWFERPDPKPTDDYPRRTVDYPHFDYWVDGVFDDPSTGFYGLGLRADKYFLVDFYFSNSFGTEVASQRHEVHICYETLPPTLVLRGTESIRDVLSDGHPNGVGFNQFDWNRQVVGNWLVDVSKTEISKEQLRPNITGHSLGGALAQWFALYNADRSGPRLGQIVTFNSPGITPSAIVQYIVLQGAQCLDPFRMPFDWAKSVTHYNIKGDVVGMAGHCYLPAPDQFNDNKPAWVQFEYTGGVVEKHTLPVLVKATDRGAIRAADIKEPKKYQDIYDVWSSETPANAYNTALSEPCFSYMFDAQYFSVMQLVASIRGRDAGDWRLGGQIGLALAFRVTTEPSRAVLANVIWDNLDAADPGRLRKVLGRVAQDWPDEARRAMVEINRRAEPCRALLDEKGASNKTALALAGAASAEEAWTAMIQWPVDAWKASASWPKEAWIAIRFWPASRWEETTKLTYLQWQQTAVFFPPEWLELPGLILSGTVFDDADGNGVLAGESGLDNAIVFLEAGAGDGIRQAEEPYYATNRDGSYQLQVDSPGTYTVRVQLPNNNWRMTFPGGGGHAVTFVASQPDRKIEGLDFGLYCPDCGDGGDTNPPPQSGAGASFRQDSDLGRRVPHDVPKRRRALQRLSHQHGRFLGRLRLRERGVRFPRGQHQPGPLG